MTADVRWSRDGSARTELTAHDAAAVVALATAAPSLHNMQPWSFVLRSGALELRADRSRHLPGTDPDERQLVLSCGAALFGARLGVRTLGRLPIIDLLPDAGVPDLLARLRVGPRAPADAEEVALLRAVAHRRSLRHGFAAEPLPTGLLHAMRHAAARERAVLLVLEQPDRRLAVAELVAAADRAQRASPEVVRELTTWTSRPEAHADGLPPGAWPEQPPGRVADGLTVRDFGVRAGPRRPRTASRAGAPTAAAAAAALLTRGDGPADWLLAGQALHRVLLTAACAGVQASLHSQPFGLMGLRRLLRDELPGGAEPQMLLQIGRPVAGDRDRVSTPRRPVPEVLRIC